MDFALDRKNKSKQKDFAMCVAESKRQFAPVLFIAKPLALMLEQVCGIKKANLFFDFFLSFKKVKPKNYVAEF
ncbi:hypothetical protein GH721_01565 [Kriegella sp. EG-1]|nr:hypothetical protein [Flavobacteriaceae bacterium EG-1]